MELALCIGTRAFATFVRGTLTGRDLSNDDRLMMWAKRREWLKGY